jgi:hypothetical protein
MNNNNTTFSGFFGYFYGKPGSNAVPAIIVQALYEKLESELEGYLNKVKVKQMVLPSSGSKDGYFSGISAADSVSLNRQVMILLNIGFSLTHKQILTKASKDHNQPLE